MDVVGLPSGCKGKTFFAYRRPGYRMGQARAHPGVGCHRRFPMNTSNIGGDLNTLLKPTVWLLGLLVSVASMSADAQRKYVPETASAAPFSQGVVVGNTLYVSGTLGLDPKTGQAVAETKLEIAKMMDTVKGIVEASGFNMDDLVSVQVFCTDLSLFDSFNEIYRTYFRGRLPARAFVGTDKLLRGAHFELMAIAVKDK